jgi:hypothetical protein
LFNYARHFVLLGSFAAALAIAGPRGLAGIGAQFALYGALHATALALSLMGGARLSPGRSLSLVAGAAILALATARLGVFGLHAVSGLGGSAGPFAILAACAGLGALAYGALIRAVLANACNALGRLRMKSLVATSLGCVAATSMSFAASRGLYASGVLWVVAPWWFAFSGGLWCTADHESRYAHPTSKPIR